MKQLEMKSLLLSTTCLKSRSHSFWKLWILSCKSTPLTIGNCLYFVQEQRAWLRWVLANGQLHVYNAAEGKLNKSLREVKWILFCLCSQGLLAIPLPSLMSCPSLQLRTLTHHLSCVFPPCLSSFSDCSSMHTIQTWYWRIELAVHVISSLSQGFGHTHHTFSLSMCVCYR